MRPDRIVVGGGRQGGVPRSAEHRLGRRAALRLAVAGRRGSPGLARGAARGRALAGGAEGILRSGHQVPPRRGHRPRLTLTIELRAAPTRTAADSWLPSVSRLLDCSMGSLNASRNE